MDSYFLAIIALIIFSIIAVLYVRISTKLSKFFDSEDVLNVSNIKEGDNDSARYDNVTKTTFPPPDPLFHLKSNGSDFTLLE